VITIIMDEQQASAMLIGALQSDSALRDAEVNQFKLGRSPRCHHSYLVFQIVQEDVTGHVHINHLASALTDIIISTYENNIIRRIIDREFGTAPPEEKLVIQREVETALLGESPSYSAGSARLESRADIMCALVDYLTTDNTLVLSGFVRFRLGKYQRYLNHLVHMAAEYVRRRRAHHEFIELLRCFVELQDPRIESTHVIVRCDGLYQLLDSQHSLIPSEYLNGLPAALVQHDLDIEDLLISALLTVAPRRIILHFPLEWTSTDAVQEIFAGRIELCPGCPLCQKSQEAIDTLRTSRIGPS